MSLELIGIIAAAIALGTMMLATNRGIRQELRELRASDSALRDRIDAVDNGLQEKMTALDSGLREEMRALDGELREEMRALGGGLREEMRALDGGLRSEMRDLGNGLRDETKAVEGGLRVEMQAGFKDLTARVVNIGDRLSKVEGVIEGLFWSSRNQPPDKPREGAA